MFNISPFAAIAIIIIIAAIFAVFIKKELS